MLPSISSATEKEKTCADGSDDDFGCDITPQSPAPQTPKRQSPNRLNDEVKRASADGKQVKPELPGYDRSRRHSVATTRDISNMSNLNKPRYDALTLRQWFTVMDTSRSGHVAKQDFFQFINANKSLKLLILHGGTDCNPGSPFDRFSEQGVQKLKEEAREMRQLLRIWKEIDEDGNGTLEWDEFLEFFKRTGHLLEYQDSQHPRARLSQILGTMHEEESSVDANTFEEFEKLAKNHTQGQRRRSLEVAALNFKPVCNTVADAQQGLAGRVQRRHSIAHGGVAQMIPGPSLSPVGGTSEVKAPEGKPDAARPSRTGFRISSPNKEVTEKALSIGSPSTGILSTASSSPPLSPEGSVL